MLLVTGDNSLTALPTLPAQGKCGNEFALWSYVVFSFVELYVLINHLPINDIP